MFINQRNKSYITEVIFMKIIPLNKQSKKAQKEYHAERRSSWNGLKPVTRVVKSKKVYDRNKLKKISLVTD